MASPRYPINLVHIYFRQADTNYSIPSHIHKRYQWYCVISGDVDQVIDGKPVRLRAEESVLIPPGVTRSPRCVGSPPGYIVAGFENHRLDLEPLHSRRVACPAELVPDLRALALELQRPGTPHGDDLPTLLMSRLLIGFRRAIEPPSTSVSADALNAASNRDIVARVEAFMQSHLQTPLSRQDFADAVNLSASHVARLFRQTTGKTLVDRLTEFRMYQARILLRQSTLPITHVALEVGYASFSHFARVFRANTGVTPSEFRKSRASSPSL
jgi:AraC-like DNA-binding protein